LDFVIGILMLVAVSVAMWFAARRIGLPRWTRCGVVVILPAGALIVTYQFASSTDANGQETVAVAALASLMVTICAVVAACLEFKPGEPNP